jgi:hypothetical protein
MNLLGYRIKKGKSKKRSQMTEIFTEDGKIMNIELSVSRNCMLDEERGNAFLIDSPEQLPGEDKNWYQVLWERSGYPVSIVHPENKQPDLEVLLRNIYRETKAHKRDEQFDKSKNNDRMNTYLWIISIICATFIIIAFMEFMKSRESVPVALNIAYSVLWGVL